MMNRLENKMQTIEKSFLERYFRENGEQRFQNETLNFLYFKKGKFLNPQKMREYIEQFTQEEIDHFFIKNEINIPRLQFCITTACTLQCVDCNALVPRFKKHLHYSLEQFKEHLDSLMSVVNTIRQFIILGGEPLLNPNLPDIIEYCAHKNICTIRLVTNGTMLPSQKLLEAIKNSGKTYLLISNYSVCEQVKPLLKVEELTLLLKENGIKYQMVDNWTWQKEGGFAVEKMPLSEAKNVFSTCFDKRCLQVLNSKIYTCPKGSGAIELGLIQVEDYIDIKSDNLREQLIEFYQKDCFEACEYCVINDERVMPALQGS